MFRKTTTMTIAALLSLALCACGSGGGAQQSSGGAASEAAASTSSSEAPAATSSVSATSESSSSQAAEYDPKVSSIDLTLDGGNIRYDHFEQANAELTEEEGALVFVFDFTNAKSTPAMCQSTFRIQFFQNGAELNGNTTYSSSGGEQYELVHASFNEAMKDGTVRFGKIVVPKDDSPVTVMVSPNGATLEDNYQTMEVPIS